MGEKPCAFIIAGERKGLIALESSHYPTSSYLINIIFVVVFANGSGNYSHTNTHTHTHTDQQRLRTDNDGLGYNNSPRRSKGPQCSDDPPPGSHPAEIQRRQRANGQRSDDS